MNLDLIIKLAKLANENPNENEANLAARKVCKLIKQADYKFTQTQQRREPEVRSASNPTGSGYEWIFYDELLRNPFWKSNRRQEDFYGNSKTWNPPPPKEPPKQHTPNPDYYKDPFTGEFKKKEKPKKMLRCKICKEEKLTAFVGLESMYVCFGCQWRNYEEEKKEK